MNWSKVKTILIILFLIINVFLICGIIIKQPTATISDQQINELKILLANNNVMINFELPNKSEKVMRLNFSNEANASEKIATKILGTNIFSKVTDEDKQDVYTTTNEKVIVDNDGTVEYVKVVTGIMDYSIEHFLQYVINVVRGYVDAQNYIVDYKVENETKKQIGLKYIYDKNYEIFNNYLTATLNSDETFTIKQGVVTPIGYVGKAKQVNYVDSLVNLLSLIDTTKKTELQSIDIGYYIDIIQDYDIVKAGEANPVWRFKTSQGIFYFDAYTGELLN